MEEYKINNRFRIELEDAAEFFLYDDEDDAIDSWTNPHEMLLDIDNSPVGEEITLEEWQGLWDWVMGLR